MNSFAAVGLLFIAAITPGPNNTFVMTAAMKGGWISAARTIGAIVAGSLILFFLTKLGLHSLSVRFPWLVSAIALAGTLFLAWLGLKLMHLKPNSLNIVGGAAPMSGLEVGAFQLLNPKGWVLMSVFVSGTEEANIASQMTVLVLIFGFCLNAEVLFLDQANWPLFRSPHSGFQT